MSKSDLDLPLPDNTKKICLEIMEWAEKNKTASFYVIRTLTDFSIILPNCPDEKIFDQPAIPIEELESYGLIENRSDELYVFTPLAHRWRNYEKKGSAGRFGANLFIALKKFFSTVWGIIVGIGIILGIILAILQILGIR